MMARPLDEIPMPKVSGSKSVPKSMQTTYEAITTLTDAFCREHLNADYRELALRMSAALCRKRPSPSLQDSPAPGLAASSMFLAKSISSLTGRRSPT
jgi:hypothetical protein